MYDSLHDLIDYDKIQKKIESGEIEIAPLAFMRGRTLKNSFAILDEAQNATETQIKMFLTRIGENSKLVVNGDPSQVDLPNKSQSGLAKSKAILKNVKEIAQNNLLIITPGIRPEGYGDSKDDQKRTMTPREAINAGANYLVIGRPITKSADPLKTLKAINISLE